MCQVIVDQGGYRLAVVGYAEHDEEESIRWTAMVGTVVVDPQFSGGHRYTWSDTELGRTTTGTAIRTGEPCIGRHIFTDPAYAGPIYDHFRKDASAKGYASITGFPLRIDGEVIGALTMAAAEPDAFDEEELRLLGGMAADLAYGIANLRLRIQNREAQATIARLAYYDPPDGTAQSDFIAGAGAGCHANGPGPTSGAGALAPGNRLH